MFYYIIYFLYCYLKFYIIINIQLINIIYFIFILQINIFLINYYIQILV